MSSLSGLEQELHADVPSLLGAEVARIISISVFALTIYDWMIAFEQEVRYFWAGSWTLSRILFLLNRYGVPTILVLHMLTISLPFPSAQYCRTAIQAEYYLTIVAMGIIQLMLLLRVWYLYDDNHVVRLGVILCFMVVFAVSLFYVYSSASTLKLLPTPRIPGLTIRGCRVSRPDKYWRMFLPSLVMHTILYSLTAMAALQNRKLLTRAPLLRRLVRDGGFFYFIVLVSVTVTTVGSFLTQYPLVNIPAIFSNYLLGLTSIALSRVMLGIHSFSSNMGADTPWMLSLTELQRVHWRPGTRSGEIVVEGSCVDGDTFVDVDIGYHLNAGRSSIELDSVEGSSNLSHTSTSPMIRSPPSPIVRRWDMKTSTVGAHNEYRW